MLEDAEKAIALDSRYFKAYLRRGEAEVELGKRGAHTTSKMIE